MSIFHNKKTVIIGLIFLYILGIFISPSFASDIKLTPHKALYSIKLINKKNSVDVKNITGKMFYELKTTCDAWLTAQKFDMIYEFSQGHSTRTTSDFSTHESFDGKSFNFTMQRKRNGLIFEKIRGSANINNTSQEAIYSIPEGLEYNLPQGTLFPISHTIAVLNKIKSGKKFYNVTIFDGSDEKGPIDVNSLILSKTPLYKTKNNDISNKLLQTQGWNIRLAFFPLDIFEETSDYEISLIIHENGVVRQMVADYDNFSVTHELIALESLDDECLTDIHK